MATAKDAWTSALSCSPEAADSTDWTPLSLEIKNESSTSTNKRAWQAGDEMPDPFVKGEIHEKVMLSVWRGVHGIYCSELLPDNTTVTAEHHPEEKRYDDHDCLENDFQAFFASKSSEFYAKGIRDIERRWEKVVDGKIFTGLSQYRNTLFLIFGILCLLSWLAFNLYAVSYIMATQILSNDVAALSAQLIAYCDPL
ncbi:hypothetical protein RB195_014599 [Necator americanus]|uniref:Anoctamin n=1 Tax=Necator americanus TaxID=51031 RepID=A0ABR1E0V9_NECAM